MKVQRQQEEEEEEMQMKVQRCGEEEEEIQPKESDSGASDTGASTQMESHINQRRGQGSALDGNVKREMESGFGTDFSNVSVHHNAEASRMSSELNAQAFTTGNDIFFNEGKYQPDTHAGKSLLAHELTHVIQQNGSAGQINRKDSAGITAGVEIIKKPEEKPNYTILQTKPETTVMRTGEGDDENGMDTTEPDTPAPDQTPSPGNEEEGPAPAPATPSLNFTPGTTLLRGETLRATIMFSPNGAETYRITAWSFDTAEHGTENRRGSDATFQNNWEGVMAISGTLTVTYRITPDGGTEGDEETLTQEITVNDRTGTDWVTTVDRNAEAALAGKPSPPQVFRDLGLHESEVTMPALTPSTISEGPNRRFRFIESLTAGTYESNPFIHPDLNDATSDFHTFHQHPGRLFLVVGSTNHLIPPADYSNLNVGGSNLSFDVPDWEAFYKAHNFYQIRATANDNTFDVPDSAWELDSNAEDAQVKITNDAAITTGLGIEENEDFELEIDTRGSWSGHEMMQAGAILAGTQSHEYLHNTHSHRANFLKMMRAIEPEKLIEKRVSSPTNTENFNSLLRTWQTEILKPDHEIVDEQASEEAEEFVETGDEMAGVNTDPGSGAFLGSIWNITGDAEMTN